jgi:hypothetical protein
MKLGIGKALSKADKRSTAVLRLKVESCGYPAHNCDRPAVNDVE